MKPVPFPQSNAVLKAPEGLKDCQDLYVHKTQSEGNPVIISCWELEEGDLEKIQKSGKVFFWAWGYNQPPVAISADNPFEP